MKTYTNIKVLKKAWNLLKKMKLEGLLSSNNVKINITELIDALLAGGQLNEFCRVITKSEVDFEEMELEDIMDIISNFFQRIGSTFRKLPIMAKEESAQHVVPQHE